MLLERLRFYLRLLKQRSFFLGNQILDTRSSSHYPSGEDEIHFVIKGGGGGGAGYLLTFPLVLLVIEYIVFFVEGGLLIIRLH